MNKAAHPTSPNNSIQKIVIPPAYKYLFQERTDTGEAVRYRVRWGGRGGAASWSYGRALIVRALSQKTRIVCFREIQKSIEKSTYTLLVEQIKMLNLSSFFTITKKDIIAQNGSSFQFAGLFRNVEQIKSMYECDIADVEEAESVSEESWKILLPTIRKPGSEIWIRFNTRYVDDPTYQRFVANAPKSAIVKKICWQDNPFFPDVLKKEMEQDRAFRPQEAKNIWDGEPVGVGRKIYPEFDFNLHVKEFDWQYVTQTGNFFCAMDPASHYYPAIVWIVLFPRPHTNIMTKYVYAEYPSFNDLGDYFHKLRSKLQYPGSLADMAREIYAHDGSNVTKIIRACDSRFAKGSGSASYINDSQGMVTELAKKENGGLSFTMPPEVTIDVMRSKIKTDLQINTLVPVDQAFNTPHLFVAPWCLNLIESLKSHRLVEQAESEDALYKDFSDALRIGYAAMDNHKYRDPRSVQTPSKSFNHIENYRSEAAGVNWMGA